MTRLAVGAEAFAGIVGMMKNVPFPSPFPVPFYFSCLASFFCFLGGVYWIDSEWQTSRWTT